MRSVNQPKIKIQNMTRFLSKSRSSSICFGHWSRWCNLNYSGIIMDKKSSIPWSAATLTMVSPWIEASRPAFSSSLLPRKPIVKSKTFQIIRDQNVILRQSTCNSACNNMHVQCLFNKSARYNHKWRHSVHFKYNKMDF